MCASISGTRQISAVSGNAFPATLGLEDSFDGRGILAELLQRTRRTTHENATAIRTLAGESFRRAARAERAFERADVRVRRISGQIDVAALAVRSQLEHRCALILRERTAPRGTAPGDFSRVT